MFALRELKQNEIDSRLCGFFYIKDSRKCLKISLKNKYV